MYKVINIPAYTYHILYLVHVGEQVSWTELGMTVYTYINSSTSEGNGGGPQDPGKPGLHSESPSQKSQIKEN